MAVVSMMRIPGDPDELATAMREHLMPVSEELAQKHGGLANIVARDGDQGLLVINLWETEDGRHAMAEEPAIRQGLERAAFPKPNFTGYEVISFRISERAPVLAGS